jgi:hypothetical protein
MLGNVASVAIAMFIIHVILLVSACFSNDERGRLYYPDNGE